MNLTFVVNLRKDFFLFLETHPPQIGIITSLGGDNVSLYYFPRYLVTNLLVKMTNI